MFIAKLQEITVNAYPTEVFPFKLLAFQWHIPESHGRWGCESAEGETREILPSGKILLFRHIECDSAL